ncbi:MAG: zinc-ribbon domain containing protein [Firmicutes bacterium]|nr:zinc-ribbon domain containing protein [Bacillota bacterium]
MFTDKTISCKDCGAEFVFSASEQEFYASKGFENDPVRCPDCRRKRKQARNDAPAREMFTVICDQCGEETQVPFRPTNGRPVYCRACMNQKKGE